MSSLGDIVIGLRMDYAQFQRGSSVARSDLGSIANSARSTATWIGALASASASAAAVMSVKLAADAEQSGIAFEVMLGSAKKAKQTLAELRDYANVSPYNMIGVRENAKLLLNMGVESQKVIPIMKMLGDVAAGDSVKFQRLALVFGQISSKGRLQGDDLRQLTEIGFNPVNEIAKKTGESMSDLLGRMKDGDISIREVEQAFTDATSAGGRFEGMTARQSQSLTGLFSTLVDVAQVIMTEIGEAFAEGFNLKQLVRDTQEFIQEWKGPFISIVSTVSGVLGTFPRTLAAIAAGLLAVVVAQKLYAAGQILILALSGPAGWATLATGTAIAAVAIAGLAGAFGDFQAAMKAANKTAEDIAGGKKEKPGSVAPRERMEQLHGLAESHPELAKKLAGNVDFGSLKKDLGLNEQAGEIDETVRKLKEVQRAKREINQMEGLLPNEQVAALRAAADAKIDKLTGITAAIAKQKEELRSLTLNETKAEAGLRQFMEMGASPAAIAEFRRLNQEIEETKERLDRLKEKNDATEKTKESIRSLRDEIALLKGEATEASLAMRDGMAKGVDSTLLQEQSRLIAERDALKKQKEEAEKASNEGKSLTESVRTPLEKLRDEFKKIDSLKSAGVITDETATRAKDKAQKEYDERDKKKKEKPELSKALSAGSSEAATAILQGVRTASAQQKQQKTAEDTLAVQKDIKGILEKKVDGNISITVANTV